MEDESDTAAETCQRTAVAGHRHYETADYEKQRDAEIAERHEGIMVYAAVMEKNNERSQPSDGLKVENRSMWLKFHHADAFCGAQVAKLQKYFEWRNWFCSCRCAGCGALFLE